MILEGDDKEKGEEGKEIKFVREFEDDKKEFVDCGEKKEVLKEDDDD